jgi:hypothetical protein
LIADDTIIVGQSMSSCVVELAVAASQIAGCKMGGGKIVMPSAWDELKALPKSSTLPR